MKALADGWVGGLGRHRDRVLDQDGLRGRDDRDRLALALGVERVVLVVEEHVTLAAERKVCRAVLALLGWAAVCLRSWVR